MQFLPWISPAKLHSHSLTMRWPTFSTYFLFSKASPKDHSHYPTFYIIQTLFSNAIHNSVKGKRMDFMT